MSVIFSSILEYEVFLQIYIDRLLDSNIEWWILLIYFSMSVPTNACQRHYIYYRTLHITPVTPEKATLALECRCYSTYVQLLHLSIYFENLSFLFHIPLTPLLCALYVIRKTGIGPENMLRTGPARGSVYCMVPSIVNSPLGDLAGAGYTGQYLSDCTVMCIFV
jgi:hypothetical protein